MEGETMNDFQYSETLIEYSNDMVKLIDTAHSMPNREHALYDLLSNNQEFVTCLNILESEIERSREIARPRRVTGEFSLAATLDILAGLDLEILNEYPSLLWFYAAMMSTRAFEDIRDWPDYYQRE